jgi:AcrR family transcriptional regulator
MFESTNSTYRSSGRPRSQAAHRAILQAANELLSRDGFAALTVEAIAAKAGVSKATIYRWWSSKAAVVMDGFLAATAPTIPFPDTGSIREDFRHQMLMVVDLFASQTGRTIAVLIAEGQNDLELAEAFRFRYLAARRREAKHILERGIARKELRADLDLDIVLDAFYGPLYYRLLVGHAPLDVYFVNKLVDLVMIAICV